MKSNFKNYTAIFLVGLTIYSIELSLLNQEGIQEVVFYGIFTFILHLAALGVIMGIISELIHPNIEKIKQIKTNYINTLFIILLSLHVLSFFLAKYYYVGVEFLLLAVSTLITLYAVLIYAIEILPLIAKKNEVTKGTEDL